MAIKKQSLHHQKAFRAITGKGLPHFKEGSDGDIQFRLTKDGLKMFVKYGLEWYQMGDAAMSIRGGEGSAPAVTSTGGGGNSGSGATRINRVTNNIELKGNMVFGEISNTVGFQWDPPTPSKSIIAPSSINYTGKTGVGITFNQEDDVRVLGSNIILDQASKLSLNGAETAYLSQSSASIIDITNNSVNQIKCTATGTNKVEILSSDLEVDFQKKIYFDGGGDTYFESAIADSLYFNIGGDRMMILNENTSAVTVAATNWVAGTVSGTTITEFSATNSSYAGMILGYTRLKGDGTNISTFEIENTMTVEDSTHQITFKTPPSEKVEIEATFVINVGSTDTRIDVGLSDSSTYNSIGVGFEYDNTGLLFSDDEVDDGVCTVRWVLEASELAAVGSSNTFYIGFSTHGVAKSAWLQYGTRSSHSVTDHPFVIKAIALPASIYDGT
tara:strand:+ start:566 stop:1894 length:1329 start_codon:yes stop_codon:yes gene_type:complete